MTGEIKDGKTVSFGAKCAIWLSCACLYVTQVTPVFYRLANGTGTGTASYIGAVTMLCGVVLHELVPEEPLRQLAQSQLDRTAHQHCCAGCTSAGDPVFITGFPIRKQSSPA